MQVVCKTLCKLKKRLLLRCIHHFKSDLINDMDHMRISGTAPSCKTWKARSCPLYLTLALPPPFFVFFDFGWFVVFESIKISVYEIHWNCNIVGLLHHPFWLYLVLAIFGITSHILNYFVWLRITDEGSVPEMRIWSISNLIRFKMVYTS